jgi:co-chaperonin GroES (HSP10)
MNKPEGLTLADAGSQSRTSSLAYDSIDQAFPDADPGLIPFGSKILVQIRTPMLRSRGGIHLPDESRDTEQWNTQVAKVIALGPVAFCNRDTLEEWPEGKWVQPGTFVRVPKYGGDRWEVPVSDSQDHALFVLFDDLHLSGEVPEDKVLETVAYLK